MISLHKICSIGLIVLTFHVSAAFSQYARNTQVNRDTVAMQPAPEDPDPEERPLNNISLTLLGDATIGSLNYERLFLINPEKFFISAGIGVGVNALVTIHADNGTSFSSDKFAVIPHHITGNIGGRSHFFEFGLGGAIFTNTEGEPYLPYLMAGYRVQPLNRDRVHFRIFGSYPLAPLEDFNIIYFPAGLSIGWSF